MSQSETAEIVWRPTPEYVERARITRLMRAHEISSLAELQRRSVEDPEWYWDAVVRDLGVRWTRPAAGTPEREHNDDLDAPAEPRPGGGPEPRRPDLFPS